MRLRYLALLSAIALPLSARAQCADGSPPPCPVRRVASAAGTVVARPLDDKNWLILPFDNVAKDQSLDVVRDASVTLLYSAMSQWNDILVVDDTRVADLMRGVPEGKRIGQEAAFDLAKRVGAGKLVMGTLIKEGSRTRLQAAVFDVKTGKRLRSPSAAMVGTDSLSSVFASLAERVLAVAAPAGSKPSESGTRNTEALHSYSLGLEAERRLALDSAEMHYRRAIALDSTFGLAHYRLSWTLRQIPNTSGAMTQGELQAAQRYAAGLPSIERGRVTQEMTLAARDVRSACTLVDQMLARDSLDAWAWLSHANCRLALAPADSNRMMARFNSDNGRISDWRKSARYDSTFFTPVSAKNALMLNNRAECAAAFPIATCPESLWYESEMRMSGDTIVHVMHRPLLESRNFLTELPHLNARARRLEMERDALSRFILANPNHPGAHLLLATVFFGLGSLADVDRELASASSLARLVGWRRQYYLNRFYLELARMRPTVANVFADSIYEDVTANTQPQAGAIVGRFLLDAKAAHPNNDTLAALRHAFLPVWAGVLPREYDQLAERYFRTWAGVQTTNEAARAALINSVTRQAILLSFFMTHRRPAVDTTHADPIYRFQAFYALGDTARARKALAISDSILQRRPPGAYDDGAWMFNAESHVLLADSAAALRTLRDFARRWPTMHDPRFTGLMSERGNLGNNPTRSYGRVWLMYADLAMATGDRAEAKRAYQFVADLWAKGEPPVQPLVARARAALAQLR